MYILHYFVPLTISHHPVFIFQTIRFLEDHAQPLSKKKRSYYSIYVIHSLVYTNTLLLFVVLTKSLELRIVLHVSPLVVHADEFDSSEM